MTRRIILAAVFCFAFAACGGKGVLPAPPLNAHLAPTCTPSDVVRCLT